MARGIAAKADILTLADGTDPNALWNEFQAALDIANEQRSALISLLTFATSDKSDTVLQSPTGTDEFEEASEYGVPKSIRNTTDVLNLGYPLRFFDVASRYTWRFLIDASAQQIESLHSAAIASDYRLQFRTVMNALFQNSSRTHHSTDSTIYPLWNADGMVIPDYNGNSFDKDTHSHYMTTAGALTPTDVEDLQNNVLHHGYGEDDGSTIVILCNADEGDEIAGYRAGTNSAKFDFISSDTSVPYLTDEMLVGDRPAGNFDGLKISGQYGRALIAPHSLIPSGYLAAVAVGGQTPVLGLREHKNFPGLRLVKGANADYPIVDAYYAHGLGAGVRQRGAAAVMQVTGSGVTTYTPPTF